MPVPRKFERYAPASALETSLCVRTWIVRTRAISSGASSSFRSVSFRATATRRSRHRDGLEDARDQVIGRTALGLGLVARHDAVAQDARGDALDVGRGREGAVREERVRARAQREDDRRARARAELDAPLELGEAVLLRLARRVDEAHD